MNAARNIRGRQIWRLGVLILIYRALTIGAHADAWVPPAGGTVDVEYCNFTTAGITPAAATLQIRVLQ